MGEWDRVRLGMGVVLGNLGQRWKTSAKTSEPLCWFKANRGKGRGPALYNSSAPQSSGCDNTLVSFHDSKTYRTLTKASHMALDNTQEILAIINNRQ